MIRSSWPHHHLARSAKDVGFYVRVGDCGAVLAKIVTMATNTHTHIVGYLAACRRRFAGQAPAPQ